MGQHRFLRQRLDGRIGSGGGGDCVGLIISSYSDSQITFTLGSGYTLAGEYAPVENGDAYSAWYWGPP